MRKQFPRIPHFPWSKGGHVDDLVLTSTAHFQERDVVQLTKLDGEGITMMRDKIYGKSDDIDIRDASRSYVMRLWSAIHVDIPRGWRIYGEYLYRVRTIYYDYLPSFFLGISVINENDVFLPWEETLEWFELLNIEPVYDLWDGIYDEGVVKMGNLHNTQYTADFGEGEGYVVRVKAAFHEDMARWRMGVYTRPRARQESKPGRIPHRPQFNQLRVDVE